MPLGSYTGFSTVDAGHDWGHAKPFPLLYEFFGFPFISVTTPTIGISKLANSWPRAGAIWKSSFMFVLLLS